jgi:hypothetical protein
MLINEICINEKIKTFGPRSDWFDKAVAIYNAKGLDTLFKYVSTSKTREDIATVRQDFMSDMDQYTTRDEAVEEWLIFLDDIHRPLT